MNHFVTNIHITKLYHLEGIDIPIHDEKCPHLIITGKNGSGKTVLLNAITEFFNNTKDDVRLDFLNLEKSYQNMQKAYLESSTISQKASFQQNMLYFSKEMNRIYGKVNVNLNKVEELIQKYQSGDFILAMYEACRIVKMNEPQNPTKPKYKKNSRVKETNTFEFLNFLSDLKIQEALARNEKQLKDADEIDTWFLNFQRLLQELYQDKELKLEFNYKDYSFRICTDGKRFKFTELSDGFSAMLDIIADLIMKMQDGKTLSGSYQKEGIVLIDEIETHLHLELQKMVLPFLTKLFPNIQFIVTTHSPFVLNSIPNAVAYDLERQEVLNDLTEYSYESLAEGYFGVKTPSSYTEMQLNRLKGLLEKEDWSDSDKLEVKRLTTDFDRIPEAISPLIVGGYRQLAVKYANRIKEL